MEIHMKIHAVTKEGHWEVEGEVNFIRMMTLSINKSDTGLSATGQQT
jgi:hypothetical protein